MARPRLIGWFTLAMALAVGFPASVSQAADATGTWKWERERNGETITTLLTLQADGNKLTGSYARGDREPAKIKNGKVDGDNISFERTFERDGNEFTITFKGKVSDDRIVGKIEFGRDGETRSFDWEAERVVGPKDVVGTWNFKIELDSGNVIEPHIVITQADGKLSGVYTSRERERKVKEIAVKDGKLRFIVAGETDSGGEFKVVYVGKLAGNKISGTVEYDFNENTGEMDFTGQKKVDAPVAGTWTWEQTRGDRTITSKLKLAVKDGKLTGTYEGSRGDPVEIENGKIDGNKIAFQITREFNDRKFVIKYKGIVSKDRLTGTTEFTGRDGETRTREFEAKRASD